MNAQSLGDIIFSPFYIQFAGITLYYYDFILTFAAEVSYIWPQPISVNTVLYFCNRYISFFGNIAAVLLFSVHLSNINPSESSCSSVIDVRETLLFLGQVAVSSILATRTIALYSKSRIVCAAVLGFGFLMIAISGWTLMVGQHKSDKTQFIHGAPGCRYVMTEKSAIHLAAAWEASALFDVFISALTFSRTLKMRKNHNMANNSETGLLDLILRDGALYFFVMALANLANIFSYYFATPTLKATFTTPASCVTSTLCSRLVLNLYEVATPDGPTTDAGSSPDSMTAGILTTRIELGISMDDDRSEVKSTGRDLFR